MPWIPLHESGIPFEFSPGTDGLVTIAGSTITSLGSAVDYSGWELRFDPGTEYTLRLTPVQWNFPSGGDIYHEVWWYAAPDGAYTFQANEAADPESDFEPAPVEATIGGPDDSSVAFYVDDLAPGLNVKWLVEIETPCFWRTPVGANQICVEGEGPVSTTAEMLADFTSGSDFTYFGSATYYFVWDTDPEAPYPYDPAEPTYDPPLEINLLDLGGTYGITAVNNCGNAVDGSHTPGTFLGTDTAYTTGTCESGYHEHILATNNSPAWPMGAPDPDVILSSYPRTYFNGSTTVAVSGASFRYLVVSLKTTGFDFDPSSIQNDPLINTSGSSSNGSIGSTYLNFGNDWGPHLPAIEAIRFGIHFTKSGTASGTVAMSFTDAILEVPPPAFTEAKLILDDYWEYPVEPTAGFDTTADYPTTPALPVTDEVRIVHVRMAAVPFGTAEYRYYKNDVEALADGVYRGRLVMNDTPGTTIATVKVVRGIGP
ncbi:MAG: hypothetical protein AB7V08_13820 [Elusimicrobiales bacterium]